MLHESNIDAAKNVSTWIGTTLFTPLVGAFLADTYWGRYKTIVIFLSVYTIGMLMLTVSAILPWLMQSSNHRDIHRVAVYAGLYLTALGNGGIKPCTSAFGAYQFDMADPAERVMKGSFFNWYFFSINVGSLLSTTVIVWVQDNVGWGIGFAVPMILMSLGFAVFVTGRRVYRYKTLGESPMTRVSQVVVAAARNCHMELPDNCSALHHLPSPPIEATFKVLHHTNQFRFLDKAPIVPPPTPGKKDVEAGPWRLCTVPQVEEVKMLLRLCPAWVSMVVFFMITAQMSSTLIEQGMAMDNRVGPFAVPPASLAGCDVVTMLVLIPVYDAALVPITRRATGLDRGLSQPQRLGVGLALSTLGMAYSALLERNRLAAAATGATGGIDCGVVEWVDGSWPVILQRCLTKLWDMFHEQNHGSVMDRQAYDKEIAKHKKQNEFLCKQYSDLVEDVGKLFEWQDAKVQQMDYENSAKDAEDVKKKMAEQEEQCKMEKLKLSKEQRCILTYQADIIRNTRKAMKEIKEDSDVLQEEKKRLESVIGQLPKAGHGSKEKLEKIKSILEE